MFDKNVLPVLPASLERLREIRTAGTEDAAMGRNLLSMDVKCDIFMHPHLQQSGNVRVREYLLLHTLRSCLYIRRQQINHQFYLKFNDMIFRHKLLFNKEKNPNILPFEPG